MVSIAPKKHRPKYLSLWAILFQIRLPLAGWVSVLHRVSGVVLFAFSAAGLYLLDITLESEAGFERAKSLLYHPVTRLAALGALWALCHHLFAGLRFLLLDVGIGIEKDAARRSGALVLVISAVATVLLGRLLW